jgi:hypothetical protein
MLDSLTLLPALENFLLHHQAEVRATGNVV